MSHYPDFQPLRRAPVFPRIAAVVLRDNTDLANDGLLFDDVPMFLYKYTVE
jgi:hypothetical protein